MLKEFFLKDLLSFSNLRIELKNGLIVFSGPSGSGKSILMEAMLAIFGFKDANASLSEAFIDKASKPNIDYDIKINDEILIKQLKKDKLRYTLNNQNISKKNLNFYLQGMVRYLHIGDISDFKNSSILDYIDRIGIRQEPNHILLLKEHFKNYKNYREEKAKLEELENKEKKIDELKEFASFELEQIVNLNPKVGEYEELISLKKQISKKDKISELLSQSKDIFALSPKINEALSLLEIDSAFYDETMNELNNIFEGFSDKMFELEDVDIENILDRIEKLSALTKKFGSIEQALEYKQKKEDELKYYANLSFEKQDLEKEVLRLTNELDKKGQELSISRKKLAKKLEEKINYFLEKLYLKDALIVFGHKEITFKGFDEPSLQMKNLELEKISTGELSRLRLALIAAISSFELEQNGILFIDEIDANVSGKESGAIASLLLSLAKNYQIFAISHQPQLSASAQQHFFVDKKDGKSSVNELDILQRKEEIARMISGKNITSEALEFAKKLLDK